MRRYVHIAAAIQGQQLHIPTGEASGAEELLVKGMILLRTLPMGDTDPGRKDQ